MGSICLSHQRVQRHCKLVLHVLAAVRAALPTGAADRQTDRYHQKLRPSTHPTPLSPRSSCPYYCVGRFCSPTHPKKSLRFGIFQIAARGRGVASSSLAGAWSKRRDLESQAHVRGGARRPFFCAGTWSLDSRRSSRRFLARQTKPAVCRISVDASPRCN